MTILLSTPPTRPIARRLSLAVVAATATCSVVAVPLATAEVGDTAPDPRSVTVEVGPRAQAPVLSTSIASRTYATEPIAGKRVVADYGLVLRWGTGTDCRKLKTVTTTFLAGRTSTKAVNGQLKLSSSQVRSLERARKATGRPLCLSVNGIGYREDVDHGTRQAAYYRLKSAR